MHFYTKLLLFFCFTLLVSCGEETKNRWNIETKPQIDQVKWIDVATPYYDLSISNDSLKKAFPEFFGAVPNETLKLKRSDSSTQKLHQWVSKKFTDISPFKKQIASVFAHLQHYYPQASYPNVYSFTGELPYDQPITFISAGGELVVGLDWFMGDDFDAYREMQLPTYLTQKMDTAFFKTKVIEGVANEIVPVDGSHRKFIEKMIGEGKKLILQDALQPSAHDSIKIGFSGKELQWCKENEGRIFLYFSEEEYLFSDDKNLDQRFIHPAPFSKFYTEEDELTPGGVGKWIGWQICKKYMAQNPEISLKDFIQNTQHLDIYKQSGYKPTP